MMVICEMMVSNTVEQSHLIPTTNCSPVRQWSAHCLLLLIKLFRLK